MFVFGDHEIRIEIPYSIIRDFLLIELTKISLSWNLGGCLLLKMKSYFMKQVKRVSMCTIRIFIWTDV